MSLSIVFSILLIFSVYVTTFCYNAFSDDSSVYREYLNNLSPVTTAKISCRNCSHIRQRKRETIDTTFHGHPKTREERWHEAFRTDLVENQIKDAESLVVLLTKISIQYLNACIPVILYDNNVQNSIGIILETFFKVIIFRLVFDFILFEILYDDLAFRNILSSRQNKRELYGYE